jgi:hypothetical protein
MIERSLLQMRRSQIGTELPFRSGLLRRADRTSRVPHQAFDEVERDERLVFHHQSNVYFWTVKIGFQPRLVM